MDEFNLSLSTCDILLRYQAIEQTEEEVKQLLDASESSANETLAAIDSSVVGEQYIRSALQTPSSAAAHRHIRKDPSALATKLPVNIGSHISEISSRDHTGVTNKQGDEKYFQQLGYTSGQDPRINPAMFGRRNNSVLEYQNIDTDRMDYAAHTAQGNQNGSYLHLAAPSVLHTHENALTNWMHKAISTTTKGGDIKNGQQFIDINVMHDDDKAGNKDGAHDTEESYILHDHVHNKGASIATIPSSQAPSQKDLHLLSLLGVSTNLNKERSKALHRVETLKRNDIEYLRQFPRLRDPNQSNVDIHIFKQKLKK